MGMSTPIINPMLFYWINTLNNLRIFAGVVALFLPFIYLFESGVVFIDRGDEGAKEFEKKTWKKWAAVELIAVLILVFVPSKETVYEMIIAQNVTVENLSNAEEKVREIFEYIVEVVKE